MSLGAWGIEWLADLDLLEFDYYKTEYSQIQFIKASTKISSLLSDDLKKKFL